MNASHAAGFSRAFSGGGSSGTNDSGPKLRLSPAGAGADDADVRIPAVARRMSASAPVIDPPGRDAKRVLAQRIARPAPVLTPLPTDVDERFITALLKAMGPERFERYAHGRIAPEFTPSALRVTASSRALADLLKRRFMTELHQAAGEAAGRSMAIQIEASDPPVAPNLGFGTPLRAPAQAPSPAPSQETVELQAPPLPASEPRLPQAAFSRSTQSRHRLEDFVVGHANRLAYNAVIQMAETPASHSGASLDLPGYSTLFIHGPCGVGKTHLLHGLATRFRERFPGSAVRMTTGEAFMNEFVVAIRDGGNGPGSGIERFRKHYRKVDLLIIDDVQSLSNKTATQTELLHTFEEIARGGAKIVLASDQHPRQLQKFSPQLISRYLAGMVAGVSPPDEELTRRIIKTLALRRGLVLDDAAVNTVATKARLLPGASSGLSVREIEGVLTRIEAVHRLLPGAAGTPGSDGVIDALSVERALGMSDGADEKASSSKTPTGPNGKPVRIETIIACTCRYLSVDPADLSGKTRHKRVVLARAVITHLARQFTTMSFPEIARSLGRPNHSTVITAFQRLAEQIEQNQMLTTEHVPEPMNVKSVIERISSTIA